MVQLISLIFTPLTYYWVPMLESLSTTKIRNNTEKAPFGIPGGSTEPENYLRVKLRILKEIGFLLEIHLYSCVLVYPIP